MVARLDDKETKKWKFKQQVLLTLLDPTIYYHMKSMLVVFARTTGPENDTGAGAGLQGPGPHRARGGPNLGLGLGRTGPGGPGLGRQAPVVICLSAGFGSTIGS